MMCQRLNCSREATHAPKVCVPCLAGRVGGTPAIETILSLACCEEHVASLGGADFVAPGDRGRETLRAVLAVAAAPRSLNFAEAWVEPVDLSSVEFAVVERSTVRWVQ